MSLSAHQAQWTTDYLSLSFPCYIAILISLKLPFFLLFLLLVCCFFFCLFSSFFILARFLHIEAVTEYEQKKKEEKRERLHEPPLNILRRPWPILLDGMGGCAYTFLNVEYEDKDND